VRGAAGARVIMEAEDLEGGDLLPGFRVRVVGWGSVTSMRPHAGSEAPPGAVVTITARAPADRR